ERGKIPQSRPTSAYNHRIAFGAWINDMRNQPLPLQDWPAPQLDDETLESVIRAMDVQSQAGFKGLDAWGLLATSNYPLDIVSVLDNDRRRRLKRLFKAAKERGIKIMFGFGLMTWGFDKILQADPEVQSFSDLYPGGRHSHAM